MASGGKELIVNARERAISLDQKRMQQFARKDLAELLRYWIHTPSNDETDAGAIITDSSVASNPMAAEIMSGLLVRPQIGNQSIFVDPGVMLVLDPDAAADDSNLKYVHDAGLSTVGALTVAANAAGSIRIDVIECQRTDGIVETDNRDMFNTGTGLFAVSNVNKAHASSLTYRVRQGVAGAGYPGGAAGWVQLAVASVPPGSANNDTVTFWDVRQLMNDRAFGPSHLLNVKELTRPSLFNAVSPAAATGLLEAVHNGRRLGGRLRRGSPGTDSDLIDLTDAANQDSTLVVTNGQPWYLYLLTPSQVPRWARYTDAASGSRVPRSPRGIPVLSHIAPDSNGAPSAGIHSPTATGLNFLTQFGVCVAAGYFGGGAVKGAYGDTAKGLMLVNTAATAAPIEVAATSFVAAVGNLTAIFDLTSGTHFPAHARELLIECRADGVDAGGATTFIRQHLRVFQPNVPGTQIYEGVEVGFPYVNGQLIVSAGGGGNLHMTRWVPLAPLYPSAAGYTQRIEMFYESFAFTAAGAGGAHLRILGWKL